MISGDVGYGLRPGVHDRKPGLGASQLTGSARTLTFSALAQTVAGWRREGDPDKRYQASASFPQPYLFYRRFAGVLSPFLEKRG